MTTPTHCTRHRPRYTVARSAHGGEVVLTTSDRTICEALGAWDTDTLTRTYWVPRQGGSVYDTTRQPGTLGQQVCERLASGGSTLTAGSTETLLRVIRRELRALLRAHQRAMGA